MITFLTTVFSILLLTEFILGNFANGFIVLVNCIDWVKRRKVAFVDQILTVLAISRMGLLWVIEMNWIVTMFNAASYSLEVFIVGNIVWIVSNHFSIWLVISLSVFYLLKIVSFSSVLFFYFKKRVNRVIFILLLGSLPSLAFHLVKASTDESVWKNECSGNVTWKTKWNDIVRQSNMTVFIISNFIPFTMSLISFLLLIFSLWKHFKKMKMNGKEPQDLSTKVHIRAMQTMTSFLLLYTSYFVTVIISIWNSEMLKNESFFHVCQILLALYPSSHSFFLILGNKKLKEVFLSLLWQ
ncbi:taste receptor type 2 member 30-like [Sorex fumeus]|uniref:taste receptor type 2 member 30-like n=1 Tax=Sorex fumeus TaxID=62283 RepID=UPI0024AE2299|nr:taste receptor type 2 member 30-like [Sorex fumeus]